MSKTINRAYLKRLAQRGELEMISSYHFDDQDGAEQSKTVKPVRYSNGYGDFKEGFCNLSDCDFETSTGGAYQNEDGTIHLRVHGNCNFDLRRKNGPVTTQSDPQFAIDDDYRAKIQEFADLVDAQTAMSLIRRGYSDQIESNRVTVKFGKKYARVDVGSSGRYMVDREGNIFGIKGYGVVHPRRRYGNLDSLNAWDFGDYHPRQRAKSAA